MSYVAVCFRNSTPFCIGPLLTSLYFIVKGNNIYTFISFILIHFCIYLFFGEGVKIQLGVTTTSSQISSIVIVCKQTRPLTFYYFVLKHVKSHQLRVPLVELYLQIVPECLIPSFCVLVLLIFQFLCSVLYSIVCPFGHWVVCSQIYGFCLHLQYLQTF